MIVGLDSSSSRPTPTIISQAWAAGVRVWGGYIATNQAPGSFNLASPWDKGSFDVARTLGSTPIGFCSGLDDPAALKALAAQWDVRLCLDVESGIRADGTWVQGWLDTSGAGLYGQHYEDTNGVWHSIHLNRRAAFHVMSWYIGRDPGATWTGPQPADGTPLAWQWQGSHSEFGLDVDRGWYDDWFAGGDMTPEEHQALFQTRDQMNQLWSEFVKYVDELGTGDTGHVLIQIRDHVLAIEKAVANASLANNQPVLDAVAALKADLDGLTLRR